jgi:hypothetical protein
MLVALNSRETHSGTSNSHSGSKTEMYSQHSTPKADMSCIPTTTAANGLSPETVAWRGAITSLVGFTRELVDIILSVLVAMEIVSPVLTTTDGITKILSEFWEAMSVGFEVQKEKSCGGHVHVTPARRDKCFTLTELQTCAFATIVAEHMVHSILSASRRDNKYCTVNSRCAGGGWARTAAGGVTKASIKNARMLISRTSTKASLRAYMQNPEKVGRYVLWNFANITPQQGGSSCTGTVEFRGGSQFLNPKTTLKWIAFVVAFIQLALDEVRCLQNCHSLPRLTANRTYFTLPISRLCPRMTRTSTHTWQRGGRGFESQRSS